MRASLLAPDTAARAVEAPKPAEIWEPSRLEDEIAAALALTNTTDRDTKLGEIFDHIDPANVPELAAAVAKGPSTQQNYTVIMRLVLLWRETDPEGALKFSAKLPSGQTRESMVTMCFSEFLAEDDPESR